MKRHELIGKILQALSPRRWPQYLRWLFGGPVARKRYANTCIFWGELTLLREDLGIGAALSAADSLAAMLAMPRYYESTVAILLLLQSSIQQPHSWAEHHARSLIRKYLSIEASLSAVQRLLRGEWHKLSMADLNDIDALKMTVAFCSGDAHRSLAGLDLAARDSTRTSRAARRQRAHEYLLVLTALMKRVPADSELVDDAESQLVQLCRAQFDVAQLRPLWRDSIVDRKDLPVRDAREKPTPVANTGEDDLSTRIEALTRDGVPTVTIIRLALAAGRIGEKLATLPLAEKLNLLVDETPGEERFQAVLPMLFHALVLLWVCCVMQERAVPIHGLIHETRLTLEPFGAFIGEPNLEAVWAREFGDALAQLEATQFARG